MNKILILALCIIATSAIDLSGYTVIDLNHSPSPVSLQASLGQNLAFKISSNPTTGYSWSIVNNDELKQDNVLLFVKNAYGSSSTDRHTVGGGGNDYFFFKASNIGSAQVKLQYKRSWESDPINFTMFTVTVA